VEVGAQVLPTFSWSGFEQQIAFRNPNGSIVLVVHNGESEAVEYMPLIDGKAMKVTLQANSFNTFFID
jgi:glucosylceramidase